MLDEKDSVVGSAVGVRMMTLDEASDFRGGVMDPLGGVGAAQELRILEGGAGCGIGDGVGVGEDPLQVGDVGGGIGRCWRGKATTSGVSSPMCELERTQLERSVALERERASWGLARVLDGAGVGAVVAGALSPPAVV